MAPPLMAVVPRLLVMTLAAFTVPLKVVIPVLFKLMAPKALAPTLPVKVMLPEPALIVRSRAVLSKLFKVEAKSTALLVVAKVVFAFKVAASL